jgi:hypothetical protein
MISLGQDMQMRRILFYAVILFAVCACSPADKCKWPSNGQPVLHILFIGNSYTSVNDLPGTFTQLACSGGHAVEATSVVTGGWRLTDHAASSNTLDMIKQQKWDYVVLQEQSEVPAIADLRMGVMYPAARQLVAKIRERGAQPLFYLTWGHRDGLPYNGMPTFAEMQNELTIGYTGIGLELGVPLVPVGKAWQKELSQPKVLDLWQSDGSHPNEQGTYLAASVFYASIFKQTPEGLGYLSSLSKESAQALQTIAAETVLKK